MAEIEGEMRLPLAARKWQKTGGGEKLPLAAASYQEIADMGGGEEMP